MDKNNEIDQETVDVISGALEEKLENLSAGVSEFEKLLALKNLTSRIENRMAMKMQAAALFGVLSKIGK
ncbi:hypothetical protein ACE1GL_002095 [Vibrio cholerae]|uniref:hypothetical protein n=1 Tax=Vibrio cholerae TaxID=666 RepID=UPI001C21034F|nr:MULTISPECIES: hypothetical protein [Vibrio]EGR1038547.1 hypothetical protein [Vibrio cholerae]EGR4345434.1 hypothetical protein [Vibrio cholerae]EHD7113032.1 hypothetical protein [Vibrio cholerae]EHV1351726.1 hypothetical protein [Vibrio cholerae]EJL6435730.1 hypothetical protein [Vibrio cholerae]